MHFFLKISEHWEREREMCRRIEWHWFFSKNEKRRDEQPVKFVPSTLISKDFFSRQIAHQTISKHNKAKKSILIFNIMMTYVIIFAIIILRVLGTHYDFRMIPIQNNFSSKISFTKKKPRPCWENLISCVL